MLKRWLNDKMPLGDPAIAPAPPHYDATWLMGKPDLILKVKRPFTLNGGGTDVFRIFILPYPIKTNRVCARNGNPVPARPR